MDLKQRHKDNTKRGFTTRKEKEVEDCTFSPKVSAYKTNRKEDM